MIMIYFVLWTVFKYFFLSCYPVLIMVKFSGSMFLLWIHKHGPYFISDSIHFFCLFVFIPFSCSWVTKYLECESLCSSCTRTEIIAMIIKKNMTKLYMHHFRGGLVYCCIVTHEKILFLQKNHFIDSDVWTLCFVPWVQYVLSFCACIII